jgi:hypothetical protein
MLADSPLLGPQAADVAAVVEPFGEPVLDVFGNPVTPAPTRMLRPPPLEVPLYGPPVPMVASYDGDGEMLVAGGVAEPGVVAAPEETRLMAPVAGRPVEVVRAEEAARQGAARDEAVHDQVVRQAGDYETPASLTPVSALTGRPVRAGRRRRRRQG